MFSLLQNMLLNVVKLHPSLFKLKAHLKCEFHKTQGVFFNDFKILIYNLIFMN